MTVNQLKHVVFTGGGTAGHVIPSLPIIDALLTQGVRITYVGSTTGLEEQLLGERVSSAQLRYRGIATGKLRRYFSWQNLTDVFRVLRGVMQAFVLLGGDNRPSVVFSKGGFVSLPVVWAAWLRSVPVVAHESDRTPGLANRLAMPFVHTLCTNFPVAAVAGLRGQIQHTGTPLRASLLAGDAAQGRQFLGLSATRPLLLVTGGSLGADALNQAVRAALPDLLPKVDVVHLCGPGKVVEALRQPGYLQFDYLEQPWGDVLAAADVVVSRAGANTLVELLTLRKPHLLVPLPLAVSRGDQLENAEFAQQQGYSKVIQESELTPLDSAQNSPANNPILAAVLDLLENRQQWHTAMEQYAQADALPQILHVLDVASLKP